MDVVVLISFGGKNFKSTCFEIPLPSHTPRRLRNSFKARSALASSETMVTPGTCADSRFSWRWLVIFVESKGTPQCQPPQEIRPY